MAPISDRQDTPYQYNSKTLKIAVKWIKDEQLLLEPLRRFNKRNDRYQWQRGTSDEQTSGKRAEAMVQALRFARNQFNNEKSRVPAFNDTFEKRQKSQKRS